MIRASLLASLALFTVGACDLESELPPEESTESVLPSEVDVSENMARFIFDDAPVFEDGFPAYGNWFVTEGYVYPGGFLDGRAGVAPDGSPAAPDAVIGTWTCRGVFVGDGAHTAAGPAVITTQYFDLYDEPGYDPAKAGEGMALITEGFESMEFGKELSRAITGGTGIYADADGEAPADLPRLQRIRGRRAPHPLRARSLGVVAAVHPRADRPLEVPTERLVLVGEAADRVTDPPLHVDPGALGIRAEVPGIAHPGRFRARARR